MLTFSIVINMLLAALLLRELRRRRKLTARLVHVGEMYLRASTDNRALQTEAAYIRNRRLETRYKLEELRRDVAHILGEVAPNGDDLRNNTNLPPLQPMPTPPECRMVKESFTE